VTSGKRGDFAAAIDEIVARSSRLTRLGRYARMVHTCHLERSERSCIFSQIRRKISRLRFEMAIADTVRCGADRDGIECLNYSNVLNENEWGSAADEKIAGHVQ